MTSAPLHASPSVGSVLPFHSCAETSVDAEEHSVRKREASLWALPQLRPEEAVLLGVARVWS